MKNWERFLALFVTLMSIAATWSSFAVLPYRLEQVEKAVASQSTKHESEKEKLAAIRDSQIRMEEQMKSMKGTLDNLDRRQRTTNTQNP